jgi:hypothetical protein
MTPPGWVDWDGRVCPDAAVSEIGRVVPIERVHPAAARAERWHAWSVATWVERCGHHVEVV